MKILDPDGHLHVDPHAVWPFLRVLSPSEVQQLQELCLLGKLKHIKFEDVLVDEEILEILARCRSPESLWVRPAAFSDTELQKLANCVSLKQVDLVEARVDPFAAKFVAADSVSYKVTENGVRQLLDSLPQCTVCVSKNDSYGFPAIAPKTFRNN